MAGFSPFSNLAFTMVLMLQRVLCLKITWGVCLDCAMISSNCAASFNSIQLTVSYFNVQLLNNHCSPNLPCNRLSGRKCRTPRLPLGRKAGKWPKFVCSYLQALSINVLPCCFVCKGTHEYPLYFHRGQRHAPTGHRPEA